jgi:hypothetical protein
MSELSVDENRSVFNYLSASAITEAGVEQIKTFDPYVKNEGETMAWCKDVSTSYTVGKYIVRVTTAAEIDKPGGWIGLSNVDFKNGANGFTARIKGKGVLRISTKKTPTSFLSTILAYVEIPETDNYTIVTVPLMKMPTGTVQLFFHFSDTCSFDWWSFF